jgi:small subunit ribosomal protein S4
MSERRKFKIQRALGLELPGLGKAGALAKRNYPPGQHGPSKGRARKLSEYAIQLREKQKLLFHYGLREEQLRRFVRDAHSGSRTNWAETLISLLERRLDNVVFRLGFARSMASARQLVSHGHILVNGRCVTIGSVVLRVGDFIRLTDYAAGEMTEHARSSPRLSLPSYLQFATPNQNHHGVLLSLPGSEHIPFEFNIRQVAEFYAKRGV